MGIHRHSIAPVRTWTLSPNGSSRRVIRRRPWRKSRRNPRARTTRGAMGWSTWAPRPCISPWCVRQMRRSCARARSRGPWRRIRGEGNYRALGHTARASRRRRSMMTDAVRGVRRIHRIVRKSTFESYTSVGRMTRSRR